MNRCYIAGQITGLDEKEYILNFAEAKREVKWRGYDPVSPLDLFHKKDSTWEDYLKKDIASLLYCEAVYALRNWQQSKGAKIEVSLAMQLNIPIIYQP